MDAKYLLKIFTTTIMQVRGPSGEIQGVPEIFVFESDEYPKQDNGMIKVMGRMVENNQVQAKVVTIYFSPPNLKFILLEGKGSSDIVIPKIQIQS